MKIHLYIITLLGVLCVFHAQAGITNFELKMKPHSYYYQRFAIYMPNEAPFGAVRDPYGTFAVKYQAFTDDVNKVAAELLIIHSSLWDRIGYYDAVTGDVQWCCSQKWHAAGLCARPNRLILTDPTFNESWAASYWYYREGEFSVTTSGPGAVAIAEIPEFVRFPCSSSIQLFADEAPQRVDFEQGGMWYMLGINCAGVRNSPGEEIPDDYPPIHVTGTSVWMNSVGYLPGQIYGTFAVYWVMVVLYAPLGIAWLVLCLIFRKNLMGLQRAIGLVIVFSLAENLLWAIDYYDYNQRGLISNSNNIIGSLLTASKNTLSRMLLLLVALGYSITTPTLRKRVVTLIVLVTAFHFFASASYQYMLVIMSAGEQVSGGAQFFLTALYMFATAVYFFWIFISLYHKYRELVDARQTEKRKMYNKLIWVLAIGFTISAILFLIQAFMEGSKNADEFWQIWWLWDAYWEFMFFAVLVTICVLWRPSPNNSRYAYIQLDDGNETTNPNAEELSDMPSRNNATDSVGDDGYDPELGAYTEEPQGSESVKATPGVSRPREEEVVSGSGSEDSSSDSDR